MTVPLRTRYATIGVLEVVNKQEGVFTDDDLALIETLATSAAIALDNAELVEALQQRTVELRARNEELDAFAHTVAHDLKGPLSVISGYAALVKAYLETGRYDDLPYFLDLIEQTGYTMSNIVDELLLLASVRQKKQVEVGPLDMALLVGEAKERLITLIEEHTPTIILPEEWPVAVGYAPWVVEVWANYFSNAIKYGGDPRIVELGADCLFSAEDIKDIEGIKDIGDVPMVRFWVRDNGLGLTPTERKRLFVPFTRLDQSQISIQGHGLGLSIVWRIVERMGGQVGVESVSGQGSTFWFTLPMETSRSG
jgi:signal transduction histidine kinase